MTTGQMLLVGGASMLFATAVVSLNETLIQSDRVRSESILGARAVSVASETLDDLLAEPFDLLPVGNRADTVATPFADFVCSTRVAWAHPDWPDSLVTGPTKLKQLRARVRTPAMPGAVTLTAAAADY